jgi:hypothetical protein
MAKESERRPLSSTGGAVLGVPLQIGERVIYYYRHDFTSTKVVLWIVGLLSLIFIIGIFFIISAVILGRKKTGARVVTNLRVISISGDGVPWSMALDEIVDVEAERGAVQKNMGLVGAIATVITVIGDNLAEKKSKMTAKYWTRCAVIRIKNRDGQVFGIPADQALVLGPFLARCIFEPGAAQIAPAISAPS